MYSFDMDVINISKYWFVELQILHDICLLKKWYWTRKLIQYHFPGCKYHAVLLLNKPIFVLLLLALYTKAYIIDSIIYISSWILRLHFVDCYLHTIGLHRCQNNIVLPTIFLIQINSSLSSCHIKVLYVDFLVILTEEHKKM